LRVIVVAVLVVRVAARVAAATLVTGITRAARPIVVVNSLRT
jgi:hypothetical protein